MFYPDLSDYVYMPADRPMMNVGWLGADQDFPVGDVDPVVRDDLVDLAADPVNETRGLHYCELCDAESPVVVTRTDDPRRRAALGFAEIHVSSNGTVYAAPTMIVHYIDEHRYLPPQAFLDGVRLATANQRRDSPEG